MKPKLPFVFGGADDRSSLASLAAGPMSEVTRLPMSGSPSILWIGEPVLRADTGRYEYDKVLCEGVAFQVGEDVKIEEQLDPSGTSLPNIARIMGMWEDSMGKVRGQQPASCAAAYSTSSDPLGRLCAARRSALEFGASLRYAVPAWFGN